MTTIVAYSTKQYEIPNLPFVFTGFIISGLNEISHPFFTKKDRTKIEELLNVDQLILFEIPVLVGEKKIKVGTRVAPYEGLKEMK